jgi:hypothetical protein
MSDRIDTDAVLHKFMLANDPEKAGHEVDLEGPLYRATQEKQAEERDPFHIISELLGEARDEVRNHTLFHGACAAVGMTGTLTLTAGTETISKFFQTAREGVELNDAIQREYAVGALLYLCRSALVPDFGASLELTFAGQKKLDDGAWRLAYAIEKSPDFAKIQQGFIDNCHDGQRYMIERHIGTQAELSVALQQNPDFGARYQHDLAFKLGVDLVVWAGAHQALPTLLKQLPPVPVAAQMEVRG